VTSCEHYSSTREHYLCFYPINKSNPESLNCFHKWIMRHRQDNLCWPLFAIIPPQFVIENAQFRYVCPLWIHCLINWPLVTCRPGVQGRVTEKSRYDSIHWAISSELMHDNCTYKHSARWTWAGKTTVAAGTFDANTRRQVQFHAHWGVEPRGLNNAVKAGRRTCVHNNGCCLLILIVFVNEIEASLYVLLVAVTQRHNFIQTICRIAPSLSYSYWYVNTINSSSERQVIVFLKKCMPSMFFLLSHHYVLRSHIYFLFMFLFFNISWDVSSRS